MRISWLVWPSSNRNLWLRIDASVAANSSGLSQHGVITLTRTSAPSGIAYEDLYDLKFSTT
jgi:hypothetical protein